ncbi:alpha-L-fucosidase [Pseudomassariella vexata]|uniref:Alpha-L-fucosidase n=1 Tax=Pseudomassariella vexata TaxID=1141098 RepID=A0A1Y2DJ66_9PEZI|nr:alpha-L-fucosidase [Pseudomassariella vexata]ORY59293.1 alpha-L-fucosidase [Pseudomassariella vexata]
MASLNVSSHMDSDAAHLALHYTSPAREWSQALPLGNGRLGCMVHGRIGTELLQLNEDSVWYGGPQDRTPHSAQYLPKLRELIRAGQHSEAEQIARQRFFSTPNSMRHYEPLGSAYFNILGLEDNDEVTAYSRRLDISRAVHTTTYTATINGAPARFRRECVASYPDNVLLMHLTSSQPILFKVHLSRRGENEWDTNEFFDSLRSFSLEDESKAGGAIKMQATPGGANSNRLCCVLGALCAPGSGTVEKTVGGLLINATDCLIAIAAQTTYRHADPENAAVSNVSKALNRPWQQLLSRHVDDYRRLFGRTSLRMWPDSQDTCTNIRLAKRKGNDAGLVGLYHNYGRYLLISSSRASDKSLPANLQGIWNPSFSPPWGSKFTININLQMNYWPAASSNLLECTTPLVDLLERMAVRGRRTARLMYGCGGWCAHHNTDIWADTDPADTWMPSSLWPLGGVWVTIDAVQMLQYRYDRLTHERLFPVVEGCVEFLCDFLITSADGKYLVSSPSLSPENTFVSPTGELGIFCEGSAMDMGIIKSTFELYLWSVDTLQVNVSLKNKVEDMLPLLPPLIINNDGLIQEWGSENYEEHEPGHRHVSHLFALCPGNAIIPSETPDLAGAAERVLARRAAHGGGHTGWSRAWLLNMHARLLNAEGARDHLELLLTRSTLPNLLDTHPPFQIDGNLGGCAGIMECLVQASAIKQAHSHKVLSIVIRLLPACPKQWARGQLSGVCVKGGWTVGFEWEEGRIIGEVVVTATHEVSVMAQVMFPSGETVDVQGLGEHRVTLGSGL